MRSGLLALGAVLFFVSGWALALLREARRRRTAVRVIHREIQSALDAALKATGPASISAAEVFAARVKLYLGPLLDIGSGEGKALGKLETALKGVIKEPAPPAAAIVSVLPNPGAGSASASAASGGASSASASAGGAEVTVVAAPSFPPTEIEREASTREHINEVRHALSTCAPFFTFESLERRLGQVRQALDAPPGRKPAGFGEWTENAARGLWHGLWG